MVFYALLIEKVIDNPKNIGIIRFDELIEELKKVGIVINNVAAIKALNQQRRLTKHYARVAEPVTVGDYYATATRVIEDIVMSVIGKSLSDIYLSDLLEAGETKEALIKAESLIEKGNYFEALIEIRKAIFIEFENDYSIYGWRDANNRESYSPFGIFARGGLKAADWMKNKIWIDEHVRNPIDYIQIDYERWRLDAMEWGINTAELENIRHLTPEVFRTHEKDRWHIKYDASLPESEGTLQNAKYCLDKTISIILKKQGHNRISRSRRHDTSLDLPEFYIGHNVYARASMSAEAIHKIEVGYIYMVHAIVSGFDASQKYYYISGASKEMDKHIPGMPKAWIHGYLAIRDETVS